MAIPGVSLFDGNGNALTSVSGGLNIGNISGTVTTAIPTGVNATQPTTNTPVPAIAGNTTVKGTPGRLFGVTVTTTGATPLVITDGPAGTQIFGLAANPALGYYPIAGGVPFNTSLIVVGSVTDPVVTLSYA